LGERGATDDNDFKNEFHRANGFLCFSQNWTDPVLWSHYGAKHQGICLGFNLKRKPLKVVYLDKRDFRQLGQPRTAAGLDDQFKKFLIRTKYKHWIYENEYRLVVALEQTDGEGSLHFCRFDDTIQLAEVILGPLCNVSDYPVRDLTNALYPEVAVFRSRLSVKKFEIVPKEQSVDELHGLERTG
jgi:hypothetical protein